VRLGEVCERVQDQLNPQNIKGRINCIGLENIESNTGLLIGNIDADAKTIKSTKGIFQINDVLYGKLRPNLNKVWLANIEGICSTDILILRSHENKILPNLLAQILRNFEFNKEVLKGLNGAQLPRVSFDYISKIKIPLPPLEIQKQLVAEAEKEQEIIEANKRLINIMEQKITDLLNDI